MLDLTKISATIILLNFNNATTFKTLEEITKQIPSKISETLPQTYLRKAQKAEIIQGVRPDEEIFDGTGDEPILNIYFKIRTCKNHPFRGIFGKSDTISDYEGLNLITPKNKEIKKAVAICHNTLKTYRLGSTILNCELSKPHSYQKSIVSHLLDNIPGTSETINKPFEFGRWLQQT